jgi:hypothetical protein
LFEHSARGCALFADTTSPTHAVNLKKVVRKRVDGGREAKKGISSVDEVWDVRARN